MSLPRDYMPIGALWNLTLGPVSNGVGAESIVTSSSLNSMAIATNTQSKSELELGILNFLKAGGNYQALNNSQVSLEGLSIITLNSPATLNNNVGQYLLYEALKAEKLKITVEKQAIKEKNKGQILLFFHKLKNIIDKHHFTTTSAYAYSILQQIQSMKKEPY